MYFRSKWYYVELCFVWFYVVLFDEVFNEEGLFWEVCVCDVWGGVYGKDDVCDCWLVVWYCMEINIISWCKIILKILCFL